MNALRLPDGFTMEQFEARTKLGADTLDSFLKQACRRGLVEQSARHIQPTPRGLDYLNDLLLIADDSVLARG
ncbi:MAG: hypothetical protein U5O39_18485 [Gammaproteobacteria bacterium]|nr:hypothetical protein [Gammaproteobacteria bacterium]